MAVIGVGLSGSLCFSSRYAPQGVIIYVISLLIFSVFVCRMGQGKRRWVVFLDRQDVSRMELNLCKDAQLKGPVDNSGPFFLFA